MIARRMRTKDLSALIRGEIESSKLKPGTPILSAKELAKKYSTSVLTAHRAIRNLADEGLVDRVKGSGSFVRKEGERKILRVGVGFELRSKEDRGEEAAFNIFPDTIADELRKSGHEAVYFTHHDLLDSKHMSRVLPELDGLILSYGFLDARTAPNIGPLADKTILIQHVSPLPERFHQVVPDLYGGFREALSKTKKLAGDKIFLLAFSQWHEKRVEAFRMAAVAEGISPDAIKEVYDMPGYGDKGWQCGVRMGEKLLREEKPFIVSVSDFISFGVVEAMLKNGKKPGEDFSLVSFDNLEGDDGFTPFGEPVLSSVAFPKKEISRGAVDMLLGMRDPPPGHVIIRRIDTKFVPRKTTSG